MKKNLYYFLTAVVSLLSPVILFSQTAPNLANAARYVLFNRNGEFTSNSASTIVIGDVGNEVGAISAFPPGFLSGNTHFHDATATLVGNDISAAYADLAGRTCGAAHGVGFGVGETLMPGIYCSTAASTLDGNLTLDAGGNAAAVFIIKIDGQLAGSSGAQVILTNGAVSCNVFWQVNGAVALSNTVFRGTVIANGAISLNTGTILDGRAFALSGGLIFGTVISTVCDAALLPLHLLDFAVTKTTRDDVQLSWITTAEVNVLRYDIETSVNGSAFYKIGSVAAQGNTLPTRYSFQDVAGNKRGVRFYRLKMIDKDASFSYSMVRNIKFSDLMPGLVNIFPNPAGNTINIMTSADARENVLVTITNMQGQKILQKTHLVDKGINNFEENIQGLSKGTYLLTLKNINSGKEARQKLQKL